MKENKKFEASRRLQLVHSSIERDAGRVTTNLCLYCASTEHYRIRQVSYTALPVIILQWY